MALSIYLKNIRDNMKSKLFTLIIGFFLSSAAIAHAEAFNLVCGLKEDLNFKSPLQVIYMRVDIENKTVNGIPSTVYGNDIITYETKSEVLTMVLPSMYLTVVRKVQGKEGVEIRFTGACSRDILYFE
jgi:hypothetical protein